MKINKIILQMLLLALVCACASSQKNDELDENRPVKKDPIIEQQDTINRKLYNQDIKTMGKTLKVPAINYDFDSIRPPEYAYPLLDKIAALMEQKPSLHLIIEGHTDIFGEKEYNYWLGGARAASMKSYLVSRGVNAERIRIHSHGKDRPLTLDNSPEGRRTNRRVEFTFTTREWKSIY